ncbi:MAG: methyl-accepting chemotaxis protein [Spirochaetes bacterium]|nr:methyl-accepting chemotaxis protein [Spirochaetota bacterium]
MKIKIKLSLLVIAIMAVAITGIAALLLNKASGISTDLSLRGIQYLASQQAEYWKGREEGYLRALRTIANVMSNYENLPPAERRDRFDDMLKSTLVSEPDMITVYSIWKPNALDNMDAHFIGRAGSGASGQYAMAFSRETGEILGRASTDIDATMTFFNGGSSKNDRVEHPFARNINGTSAYLIRFMVPITNPQTNETVGAVGCLINIAPIQPVLEKTIMEHEEIAIMIIYSGNGFILAHFLPDRIGKKLIDVDKEFGKNIQLAYQAVLEGKGYRDSAYDPTLDTNIELVIQPVQIGSSDTTWSIMIGTTEEYVQAEVRTISKFTIVLALIAILITAVIVFIVLAYVTKPIVSVTDTLKDISEGDGDLTRAIPEKGNDEIADMSRYFNKTMEKIKHLVGTIKEQTVIMMDTGNELAANMTQTAAAVNEITANTQNIKSKMLSQSASVTQTSATMEQITDNIGKLNGYVENQAASVAQSSSAIEEMLANIQFVTQTLIKNSGSVSKLSSDSEVGSASLHTVAADIQKIAMESEGLLEINSVMQKIASQTNLLSMNAAIEAAHAGEAGKGFAVVADEIRQLAESSSAQSKTTSAVLKKIKESIDKIKESTGNVLEKFEAINSGVKTVSEQEEVIRSAMEEQSEGSKQILEAVGQLNEITGQVKGGSIEMFNGSKEVSQESKNLEIVTQDITDGINEMASGAQQINIAVTRVNEISVKNKENIDLLVKEVERFKIA